MRTYLIVYHYTSGLGALRFENRIVQFDLSSCPLKEREEALLSFAISKTPLSAVILNIIDLTKLVQVS